MAKTSKHNPVAQPSVRDKSLTFQVNDEELKTINAYLDKYKIKNRSRWIRETMLSHILKVLEQDYPTLFGENEMRR